MIMMMMTVVVVVVTWWSRNEIGLVTADEKRVLRFAMELNRHRPNLRLYKQETHQ